MATFGRVIALVDMDCFYVQVEQRRNPELKGKPCAVVQYNAWKGGGIIAVSYEARHCGVTRNMRGDEAKLKCPDIHLVQVPTLRGKANLTHYRQAGAEVMEVLSKFPDCCERASVDEAYIDLTETVKRKMATMTKEEIAAKSASCSYVEGHTLKSQGDTDGKPEETVDYQQWLAALDNEDTLMLAVGSLIIAEMRAAVLQDTSFTCSAGIAHNKMLAKLCCGLHKPDKQTILPANCVQELFKTVKVNKVRNLGGKFGAEICSSLGIQFMGELAKFSLNELKARFGDKGGEWTYYLSQGIDQEPVRPRQLAKSTGCGKNFPGRTKLATKQQVKHWVEQLAEEMQERLSYELDINKREGKHLTTHFNLEDGSSFSRSCPLKSLDDKQIASDIFQLLLPFNSAANDKTEAWYPAIVSLQIGASKFTVPSSASSPSINSFFSKAAKTQDGNDEKLITPVTRASCENIHTLEKVSNQPGFDKGKDKKPGKVIKEPGIGAFFLSRTATSKEKDSNVEQDHSPQNSAEGTQNSAEGNQKIIAAPLSLPAKAGITHFLLQKQPARFGEIHEPTQSCNPYEGCRIDQDILQSLPEEIQREILSSFGNHCKAENRQDTEGIRQFAVVRRAGVEDTKRDGSDCIQGTTNIDIKGSCSSGAYAKLNHSDLNFLTSSNSKEVKVEGSYHSYSTSSDEGSSTDKIKCKRCGEKFSTCDMPVHMDYHFAKELEQADYSSSVSVELNSPESGKQPPKKKKRTSYSIESFFSQQ